MTDERQLAVAYLGLAIATAIAVNAPVGLALVALSLVALLVGYLRKWTPSTAFAGLLLYYPLALSIGRFIPGEWSYLGSAILLILLSERLSFEYQLASALEAPLGIDEESRLLAARMSRAHGLRLLWYAALASIVSASSILSSAVPNYPYLPAVASVLLVFALWAYARR